MKFETAKITNSRLMGSMGLLIKWRDANDIIYQYYLLDAEGLGISDYTSLKNPSIEQAYKEEERLMGALGADRIVLDEKEALFLVHNYGNKNAYYEKPLPGDTKEYINIIQGYKPVISAKDIYPKIYKKITDEIEFINYITMRFIALDKESLMYYSQNKEISNMHITNINATLLKNRVTLKGKGKYISDAIYEDSDGYYTCKIAFNISKEEEDFKLNSILIGEKECVYDFEVFNEISKQEYVSIYKLNNSDAFIEKLHEDNPFMLRSDMEDGTFFTRFNFDNKHVARDVYVINNDIKSIYYQIGEQFFVGTYCDRDRRYINKLLQCKYSKYLELKEELYFDENVLYDFVESGSDDFEYFIE